MIWLNCMDVHNMELRNEIEPQLDIAEKRYPEILKLITAYTSFCDENGDEDHSAYKKLEEKLQDFTQKDMSQFNLSEWWEEEGAEVLSFRIGLPDPLKVENIKKEELVEILNRVASFEKLDKNPDDQTFKNIFSLYLDGYYHRFLALNFKTYNYRKLFTRQKDKDKKDFWYTENEKAELLWNAGKH